MDNLESNSAARRWQTSGCVKDAPSRNLSRLMEWGAESRDPPVWETKEETFYMLGKGRAVICLWTIVKREISGYVEC